MSRPAISTHKGRETTPSIVYFLINKLEPSISLG
jgi:hypothetical protein